MGNVSELQVCRKTGDTVIENLFCVLCRLRMIRMCETQQTLQQNNHTHLTNHREFMVIKYRTLLITITV